MPKTTRGASSRELRDSGAATATETTVKAPGTRRPAAHSSGRSKTHDGTSLNGAAEKVALNGASSNGTAPQNIATKRTKKNAADESGASLNGRSRGPAKQARTELDIEHFRSLLFIERTRLESEREQIRNNGLDVDGALPEDGEGGEEDTADLASAMMDKEFDLSIEDELEELLSAVDHALQKIEDGTYGVCDMSGEPIPKSRLELIPYAALTVECQAMAEFE